MRLAEFILTNQEPILEMFDSFAQKQTPAAVGADAKALRDHAAQILEAITADMREPETPQEASEKSRSAAPVSTGKPLTAAEEHGALREALGFDINQTVSEYRALRAAVTKLWLDSRPQLGKSGVDDLVRFNEAIDQAVAESVRHFSLEEAKRR
jgi:hypothetical protein